MTDDAILKSARRVLELESEAVTGLVDKLDGAFVEAVETIYASTGKVVVTGMGKSGIICQKIASTLASTGTSSFFLHPAEGLHGDLGVLMKNDVLLAVSNSGETEEILRLMSPVKRLGAKLIVMTGGGKGSSLAKHGDVFLDVGVSEEACPLGLAPTASTTATLALGDALAVALLERRGFRAEDFAILHPAGSLGKKLLQVDELMHGGESVPRVEVSTPMKDVVLKMTEGRLGLTGVFDDTSLVGIVTDGDLRRALEGSPDVMGKVASEVMSASPKTIASGSLVESALQMMDEFSITALFVTDESHTEVLGVLHLHDLIKAGAL